MGDGSQDEVEDVFHAHRPRGGLLQKSHSLNAVQNFKEPDQSALSKPQASKRKKVIKSRIIARTTTLVREGMRRVTIFGTPV